MSPAGGGRLVDLEKTQNGGGLLNRPNKSDPFQLFFQSSSQALLRRGDYKIKMERQVRKLSSRGTRNLCVQ